MSKRADVGDTIPDIALEGPNGDTVRPADFLGRKLVLFFYPKDDTPGCTTENKDFSALAGAFAEAGAALRAAMTLARGSPVSNAARIAEATLGVTVRGRRPAPRRRAP